MKRIESPTRKERHLSERDIARVVAAKGNSAMTEEIEMVIERLERG